MPYIFVKVALGSPPKKRQVDHAEQAADAQEFERRQNEETDAKEGSLLDEEFSDNE